MEFRKIISVRNQFFPSVWNIYEEAFLVDEQRSREAQKKVFKKNNYLFYTLRENKACIGLLAAWTLNEYTFIEHFAIHRDFRNQGIGLQAIKSFQVQEPMLVLETDRPTTEVAQRRIEFWKRAGFKLNTCDYIQPPYDPRKNPVPMYLMTLPSTLTSKTFSTLRDEIHKVVYGYPSALT